MNRPSSEPLPFVFAVAMTVNPGCSWFDVSVDFLDVNTITFKNRLETHDFVRCKVNLIKEKNCTTLHSNGHRTKIEFGFTINQTKSTNEVILISFNSHIDTYTLDSIRHKARETFKVLPLPDKPVTNIG